MTKRKESDKERAKPKPVLYNPLDRRNLGVSVADALLSQPVMALQSVEKFLGAGIYCIYYAGDFKQYAPLAKLNKKVVCSKPIYVGKAVPSGARKGATVLENPVGTFLWNRIGEHADSIESARNLSLADFTCRYLPVDDIWIPLGETMLIQQFRPLWNLVVDGFGNHDPGKGRYNQEQSCWDTIHPGRAWALKCRPNKRSADEILSLIAEFLKGEKT